MTNPKPQYSTGQIARPNDYVQRQGDGAIYVVRAIVDDAQILCRISYEENQRVSRHKFPSLGALLQDDTFFLPMASDEPLIVVDCRSVFLLHRPTDHPFDTDIPGLPTQLLSLYRNQGASLFLFGSRAIDLNTASSDYDILIVCSGETEKYLASRLTNDLNRISFYRTPIHDDRSFLSRLTPEQKCNAPAIHSRQWYRKYVSYEGVSLNFNIQPRSLPNIEMPERKIITVEGAVSRIDDPCACPCRYTVTTSHGSAIKIFGLRFCDRGAAGLGDSVVVRGSPGRSGSSLYLVTKDHYIATIGASRK